MSGANFRIAFEGEPFNDGEIEVSELAPALIALGEVIQAANRALNGDRAEARLKIRATNTGSFEALLSIDISVINAIRDMLDVVAENPDRVIAADSLLDLLIKGGKIVGGTVFGVFATVTFLRGRKPDKVEARGDGHTSISVGPTTIIVDNRTVQLLGDLPTREALQAFGDRALSVSGVSRVRLGESGTDAEVSLTPSDRGAFRVPEPANEDPVLETVDRELFLRIVTSHFRNGYKWRFTDGGERPFTADMQDVDFLNDVLEGKITLSANDTLRCLVREEQCLTSTGLTKEIKVIRVIEHIVGAKQLKLL